MKNLRSLIIAAIAMDTALTASLASPTQEEQRPRFRTEVAAVLVDVLVLDEEGEPVSGLTREDFEVYEDGIKQEIRNFDVIDWTSYVARQAPREGERAETGPAPAVNTFPRRFIFIINRLGAEFGFMVRARRALESFVVESMADGDEAMVIDMGNSTRIIQQFTPLKEETLQAVKKLRPMRADVFYGTHIGTRNVYETLESLGDQLTAVPGRKIILFMSPELSRTRDLLFDLRRTVDALNQSNTSVYSIDIEGTTAGMGADNGGILSEVGADLDAAPAVGSSFDSFDIGGLFPLAYETGGSYFYNLNSFEPAVQQIGQENRRYYLLTYVPANTDFDRKYRRIEVRVNRANVTVKARKGYFPRAAGEPLVADEEGQTPVQTAPPQQEQPTPEEPVGPPADAETPAPRPPAQLEITNYLLPAADGKVDVPIAVALPLELLTTEGGPSTLTAILTDASGGEAGRFSAPVDPENFSAVRRVTLKPGSYLLQITLTQSNKEIYQSSTQLDVPPDYGERFGVSTIVPIDEPVQSTNAGLTIRPTQTLRVGEDAYFHFRVFPGKRGGPSRNARIIVSIFRGEEQIASLEQPERLDLSKGGETGFPAVVRLPTGKLPPGKYRIVVQASDPDMGKRASGEIEVSIIP